MRRPQWPMAVFMLCSSSAAFGYIDTGSGYMNTQLIAAILIGFLFYPRKTVGFIGGLLKLRIDRKETAKKKSPEGRKAKDEEQRRGSA